MRLLVDSQRIIEVFKRFPVVILFFISSYYDADKVSKEMGLVQQKW